MHTMFIPVRNIIKPGDQDVPGQQGHPEYGGVTWKKLIMKADA